MNLSDAITAVEGAISNYTNATAQTANDQTAAAAAQAKADAAAAVVAGDTAAQATAAQAQNDALTALVAAAQAAMPSCRASGRSRWPPGPVGVVTASTRRPVIRLAAAHAARSDRAFGA